MAQLTAPLGAYGTGDTEARTLVAPTSSAGGQGVTLGMTGYDGAGNRYRYIRASAAIAQYDAVRLAGSALAFDTVLPTSAVNQTLVGAAQTAFANLEYGWVLAEGIGTVKTSGALAANITLTATAVAGTLGLSTAADLVDDSGVVLVNSASPQVAYIKGL